MPVHVNSGNNNCSESDPADSQRPNTVSKES